MWSDAGGGGFNTSFGGDDGAGYGTQQFSSPGPDAKRSQSRRIERVVPLTIRSVLELDENNPDYHGFPVSMVMVMGLIREVEVSSTKVSYTLDDTTGTIKAVKWLETDAEEETLMENTYCSVYGTCKSQQGNKQLLAIHLEPVTDFNFITAHIIEVMHAVMGLQKIQSAANSNGISKGGDDAMVGDTGIGGTSTVMSNSLVGFGGMNANSSAMNTGGGSLTKPQRMVFEVIQTNSSENDDSGCARNIIKAQLKGKVMPQQVDECLFYLSNEGHIYTTLDEDHFKATDA